MAYLLDGQTIRRPSAMDTSNNSQYAQQRTLDGSWRRDYFGANKTQWVLHFVNVKKEDWDVINAIYQAYLSTGTAPNFEITEENYTVPSTPVHINLDARRFSQKGTHYLSEFDLTLTEV